MVEKLRVPTHDEPMIDPKTGKVSQRWYQFFQQLARMLNG